MSCVVEAPLGRPEIARLPPFEPAGAPIRHERARTCVSIRNSRPPVWPAWRWPRRWPPARRSRADAEADAAAGGWGGGGHAIGRSAVGGRVGVGHHAIGSPFASEGALNRAYHGRYGGYGGYGGGGDYWGGYYGGGGVYYGDADYGYGYGGYYDNYAAGVPAAYSALTYPPNYDQSYGRIYQLPTTVYQPAVGASYVPVTTYQAQPHIIYLRRRNLARRTDAATAKQDY